ncbi:AAA ATPase-like protein [Fragilaria crotonensis]|nr:AAA ATPase-like protein [Fragilaria crotonensis]
MAKKKKKADATEAPKEVKEPTPEVPILDWMDLTLLNVPKGKAIDSQQIILTKQDAYSLDILNGDDVIVLVHTNGIPEKAAICSARVVSNQETPRKSPTATAKPFSKGSCHVVPPFLLERLCRAESDEVAAIQEEPATPASKNKGFSFAKGGGGDAFISPSKAVETLRKPPTLMKKNVWIVPLFNPLGARLTASLCKPCSSLTLLPTASIPANALRVVQKMVALRTVNKYVVEGESIGISFQGKLLQLTIKEATSRETSGLVELERAVDELKLDSIELDAGEHIAAAVKSSVTDPTTALNLQLFQVLPDTKILIECENAVEESSMQGPFVAGLDDAISQVMTTMVPALLRPEAYGGLAPPRGCLLFGPSGVGKSALARQIAWDVRIQYPQIDVDLVHCSSIQSHAAIVGEGERMLTKLFTRSRKTLVILDDVHFICPKRGSDPSVDRLASTLLALMDGVERNNNVFVLGTTADPAQLDPALRRPGRLDDEVEVPIPDEKTRAKIWKFHIGRLRDEDVCLDLFSEEDLSNLASLAKGFTGADCLLAIKEATRIALKDESKAPQVVTMEVLKAAIGTTKPSTISSITVEVPKVYWNSIGGMIDVKQKLREAIELPLTHADLFAKYNIPPPRGVLLYGPPGCSKTLMARALATEGKLNFLAVKGPELLSKWLGESERALASLSSRADGEPLHHIL